MDFISNPRGMRNNNPGNIKLGIHWKGEEIGLDKTFEAFTSIEWGIRAIYKILDAYSKKYGINTIKDVISRYAPSSENKTDLYIKSVIKYMMQFALAEDAAIIFENESKTPLDRMAIRTLLVAAIIHHENGIQPFNLEFIQGCAYL